MNVDSAMLEQMRQNPATAVQDDKVVCLECGLLVRRLTRSPKCHARNVHKLDAAAYLAKWPGAPLQSESANATERDATKLYKEIHADELKVIRGEYRQQPEVRARENELKRKRWPGWYAEHKEAESERRAERHETNKEQENKQQRNRYHDNLAVERAKNRDKATEIRRLAKLALVVVKGRPRNESLIARTLELKAQGKSYGEIAIQVNAERGRHSTPGAYQKMVERQGKPKIPTT
jgi:hypothetical protein